MAKKRRRRADKVIAQLRRELKNQPMQTAVEKPNTPAIKQTVPAIQTKPVTAPAAKTNHLWLKKDLLKSLILSLGIIAVILLLKLQLG